jgi:hypothetical protein
VRLLLLLVGRVLLLVRMVLLLLLGLWGHHRGGLVQAG